MPSDDEMQRSSTHREFGVRRRLRTWLGWITGIASRPEPQPPLAATQANHLDVHATLRALPKLLDGSSLPDGVVELLIENLETPTRQLFDIHDGRVTLVEPGKCVPWASISGPPTAWAMALGPQRNTTQLQLTGDEQLARRVLAALPQSN